MNVNSIYKSSYIINLTLIFLIIQMFYQISLVIFELYELSCYQANISLHYRQNNNLGRDNDLGVGGENIGDNFFSLGRPF